MMVWINSVSHFSGWRYYRNLFFQWKAARKIYALLRKRICQELYPKNKIFTMVFLKNIQFRNIAIFDNLFITTASGLAEIHFQAKRLCSIQSNKAEATYRALFWSFFLLIPLNLNSFWTVWANVNHLLKKSIIYNDFIYFGGWKFFCIVFDLLSFIMLHGNQPKSIKTRKNFARKLKLGPNVPNTITSKFRNG